jgi:2-octaprenyl-6-methoxyphenol hydroxylase
MDPLMQSDDRKPATVEVAVIGGGPAGLTAAIAVAAAGVETALVCAPERRSDNRTTALLKGSVSALEALRVWEACHPHAAPLRAIRMIDATRRLVRAPEVMFEAAEIGVEAFGHNIENRHLMAALDARAAALAHLQRFDAAAIAIEPGEDEVLFALSGGERVRARLVIGADGRRSLCRQAAGISTEGFGYEQTALTVNLQHTRPHDGVSTEFHTETGPFTLVPLPEKRSSLVYVVSPGMGKRLKRLEATALAAMIEQRSHSLLGQITVEGDRGFFGLGWERARRFAERRIVLVGEAAHVIPPIGAQGLNIGLRDAATIAELVVAVRRRGGDVGATTLTDRYDAARRADVTSRSFAVDLLNRSLLSDFLPVQGVRGLGLYLLDRIGPLRRAVMREGMVPTLSQPRLMRGQAL